MGKTEKKCKRRGGLEFLPLPKGKTEEFFRVPCGLPHPGQLDLYDLGETVRPDGKRAG